MRPPERNPRGFSSRSDGRDGEDADAHLTFLGLKHTMREAIALYARNPNAAPECAASAPRFAELYPAAAQVKQRICIHCQRVYAFSQEAIRAAGQYS